MSHRIWTLVRETAARERDYEPESDAVSTVRNAFRAAQLARADRAAITFARLMFDSLSGPIPAGVRGEPSPARQLLHEAGDYVINVRLERESEHRIWVAGQILLKSNARGASPGTVTVISDPGSRVLAHTTLSDAGEFHLSFGEHPGMAIYLHIHDATMIAVSLPEPHKPAQGIEEPG
jgi:hypothetical protein